MTLRMSARSLTSASDLDKFVVLVSFSEALPPDASASSVSEAPLWIESLRILMVEQESLPAALLTMSVSSHTPHT